MVDWPWPVAKLKPYLLADPHPTWWGIKWEGQKQESSIREPKQHVQAKQNKELIYFFPSANRYLAISKEAGLHYVQYLLGKPNAKTRNFPPPTLSLD